MILLPTSLGLADLRHADEDDLAPLYGPVAEPPDGTITGWHLVHIAVGEGEVHALGMMFGDVYITSPVKALDVERSGIRTRSGRVYHLGARGEDDDMRPSLTHHLVYALMAWGYVK